MGEYFDWVNIDRKEYLCPTDFDLGNKLRETSWGWNPLLLALYDLLYSDWKDDTVVFLGDYAEKPCDTDNPALLKLREQCDSQENFCEVYEMQLECYKCISGLYKDSEKEVRNEIEHMLQDDDYEFNYYGIDKSDPFKGLFERTGQTARFTINETKREYFDIFNTETINGSKNQVFNLNPLPELLAYGRNHLGRWVGDKIRVSNDPPPSDYVDVSNDSNREDLNIEDDQFLLIDWKKETTLSEKEGVGICLARGESKTMNQHQINSLYGDSMDPSSEIIGGWTAAFEQIFKNVGDEDILDAICYEVENDLIDETRELTCGIVSVLQSIGVMEQLQSPLHIFVEYVLDDENNLVINLGTNLSELLEAIDTEKEIAITMIDGIFTAYGGYYGQECCKKWRRYVNYGFHDPHHFKELVCTCFRKYLLS